MALKLTIETIAPTYLGDAHVRRIPPGRGQKNIKASQELIARFDSLCAERKQAPEHVLEYLLDLHAKQK